jgi:hypothetical protein
MGSSANDMPGVPRAPADHAGAIWLGCMALRELPRWRPLVTYKDPNYRRARQRQLYHAKLGQPAAPPAGYISLREVAKRLHYAQNTIRRHARRGDFGPIWTRGPRSTRYVSEEAIKRREAGHAVR